MPDSRQICHCHRRPIGVEGTYLVPLLFRALLAPLWSHFLLIKLYWTDASKKEMLSRPLKGRGIGCPWKDSRMELFTDHWSI